MPPRPDSACSWQDIIERVAAWRGRDLVIINSRQIVMRGPVSDIVAEGGPGSRFVRILLDWCARKGSDEPETSWRLCLRPELRADVSRPDQFRLKSMHVAADGSLELALGLGLRHRLLPVGDNLSRPSA